MITALSNAYMVANCTLSGPTYVCADSRNLSYLVDIRASSPNGGGASMTIGNAGATSMGSGTYSLAGSAGGIASWLHSSRITSMCADKLNSNLLFTSYINGMVRVWDLRRIAQPLVSGDAISVAASEAVPPLAARPSFSSPLVGATGASVPNSESAIVSEWSNDDSRAPVWHIGLTTNHSLPSLSSGTAVGSSADSSPSIPMGQASHSISSSVPGAPFASQGQLLSISEDGMARVFNVHVTDENSSTTYSALGSPLSAPPSVIVRHNLRTLVPGIHARGMPIKATMWQGADFSGKGISGGNGGRTGGKELNSNGDLRSRQQSRHFLEDHDDDSTDDEDEGSPSSAAANAGARGGKAELRVARPDAPIHELDLLIVGSSAGNASVFDVTDPEEPVFIERLEGHKSMVTGLAAIPPCPQWRKPLIATYSNDHTVRLYTSI
eukprot:GILI01027301.1.p1 GENE.GILI01027301.1~~GILI01027301.1.p1  ORF type:complete len:438 (+),score=79.85 GILI01027301.1:212-1525(+)